MNMKQIANMALQLGSKDRAVLAEALWESLEDPYLASRESTDEEALQLAKLRDNEISRGAVSTLSHTELMTRLRRNEN